MFQVFVPISLFENIIKDQNIDLVTIQTTIRCTVIVSKGEIKTALVDLL